MSADIEPPTCECACGCVESATTTDDGGIPVCDVCATYMVTDDGDIVCRGMGLGETCHVCRASIQWGGIRTGDPGSGASNYRDGTCECGEDAWRVEEAGGSWDRYSYGVEEAHQ